MNKRKNIKTISILLFSSILAMSLAGCGKNTVSDNSVQKEGTGSIPSQTPVSEDGVSDNTSRTGTSTTDISKNDIPQVTTGDSEEVHPSITGNTSRIDPKIPKPQTEPAPDAFNPDTERSWIEFHTIEPVCTIFLDPGHGGDAACVTEYNGESYERAGSGAAIGEFPANSLGTSTGTSGGGYSECDIVYQIALKVKERIENDNYAVVLSRDDCHTASAGGGTAAGNWERGRLAAEYDAWVVIHADSGGGHGIHCVSYNCDKAFSNKMSDTFIQVMEEYGRPIYTSSGYNHGYSGNSSGILQAPSKYIENGGDIDKVLYVEAGFMDNEDDLAYLLSEKGQNAIADAIARAIMTACPPVD